jgi:hypothetical protein
VMQAVAVPEPKASMLFAAGLLLLGWRTARRGAPS